LSNLTKLFVVLLVLLSIALTAGTVVFVNRVDNAKDALDKLNAQVSAQEAKASSATADAEKTRAEFQAAQTQAQSDLNAARNAALTAQQSLADRDARIAQLQNQLALGLADLGRLTEAVRASEASRGQLQQSVQALSQAQDKNLQEVAQLNARVSELTNNLEVTERERRYFQEQYTEAQKNAGGGNAPQSGATPAGATQGNTGASARANNVNVNGVIRATRNISGVPYATISLGSSDGIQKGMKLYVIDQSGSQFLGRITVDTVEPNEATGVLDGPKVNEVAQGAIVRSQI
jgi:uncharacterized protein (DUF3084 family)